jgi:hypothetical protein
MWGLQWCVKPWIMGQPHRVGTRVVWKSPFYVNCKFGVLQYVLLKFVTAVAVLLLEWKGLYKEGNFTPKGGYLYICLLTNLSQCWALYCLIFFYYATKNELGSINPVGKFLSVKALVFFTWWQSVFISMLYQMDMIPHYQVETHEYSPADVAKGLQDYLICIEMFVFAVVHIYVFPHSEYAPPAVEARTRAIMGNRGYRNKRLGRWLWKEDASKNSGDRVELVTLDGGTTTNDPLNSSAISSLLHTPPHRPTHSRASSHDDSLALSWMEEEHHEDAILHGVVEEESVKSESNKTGFVRALIDSALPLDLGDQTVGVLRGDYHVERKTLLHHATSSDQYDIFSRPFRKPQPPPQPPKPLPP